MRANQISFTPHNIRQILDGKKTQTRRVIKQHPKVVHAYMGNGYWATEQITRYGHVGIKCSYGQVGDRLLCREPYRRDENGTLIYAADHLENLSAYRWNSSRFMPYSLSRLMLILTKIRVEKVADITNEDCLSEGIEYKETDKEEGFTFDNGLSGFFATPRKAYYAEWEKINGKKEENTWEYNPYVWVLDFKTEIPQRDEKE